MKRSYFSLFYTICLAIAFSFFLSNCAQQQFFEKNIDLPKGNWYIDSVLVFKFKIEDNQTRYNLLYNLRNTLNYPYYNMYITYYLEDDKGKLISTELQNVTLMDSKTGKPFGSGLGDIFSHQLPIPVFTKYKFPKTGNYTFKVKQYMRQDPLPGILTFGLRIEKAN